MQKKIFIYLILIFLSLNLKAKTPKEVKQSKTIIKSITTNQKSKKTKKEAIRQRKEKKKVSSKSKLLDKIEAVFDGKIITKSDLEKIRRSKQIRKQVAPQIYNFDNFKDENIINSIIEMELINSYLLKNKIEISDKHVEEEIKKIKTRLGVSHEQFINLLINYKVSYDEYFNLTKATIQKMMVFIPREITPQVSISEQQVKNAFYRKYKDRDTLNFKYQLKSFSISKNKITLAQANNLPKVLKNYTITGNMPKIYNTIETYELGAATEEGLNQELKKLLKETDEGSFSKAIVIGSNYKVFYVKEKNLVESEIFIQEKPIIFEKLFKNAVEKTINDWKQREKLNHHIVIFNKIENRN